jgi:hydroxymethylglutaryl-CoA reductase
MKLNEAVNILNEVEYEFYKEVAETISRNTATRYEKVLNWLKNNYPNKMDVINMMGKYASKKKWTDIAMAIINNKKI